MKSKTLIIILIALIAAIGLSQHFKLGVVCGNWSTALGGGNECQCYGWKYNAADPEIIGGGELKCIGYCPLETCKDGQSSVNNNMEIQ